MHLYTDGSTWTDTAHSENANNQILIGGTQFDQVDEHKHPEGLESYPNSSQSERSEGVVAQMWSELKWNPLWVGHLQLRPDSPKDDRKSNGLTARIKTYQPIGISMHEDLWPRRH